MRGPVEGWRKNINLTVGARSLLQNVHSCYSYAENTHLIYYKCNIAFIHQAIVLSC